MTSTYSISSGETEEIAAGDPGDAFYVNVSSGTIRLDYDRRYARKGVTIPEDQTGEITLREYGERVYAYADGGDAEVTVRPQGFELSLFGREIIRVDNAPDVPFIGAEGPQEQALGVGYETEMTGFETVSSGFTQAINVISPASTDISVELVTFQSNPIDVTWTVNPSINNDSSGSPDSWFFSRYPEGVPLAFDPGIYVPEGGGLDVDVRQESGSSQDCRISVLYRTLD